VSFTPTTKPQTLTLLPSAMLRAALQDKIPIISDIIELIGIGVTGW
jgi:hypothetical protein